MTKPYRACHCRGPSTTGPDGARKPGKLLGKKCPELKRNSKHGRWYVRYEAPSDADGGRRQVRLGPYDTKAEAQDALTEALGELRSGTHAANRKTTLGTYLDTWLEWHETELKPRTLESYEEAFRLYWKPALGHMRLADLTEGHIRQAHAAMRKLNTPAEDGDRSEMLRRLAAARATLPHLPGRRVRLAPLSEQRIKRVTAPLITALNQCKALPVNPAKGTTGKVRKARPVLWTEPRVERWRKEPAYRPGVMVWTAEQCGAFLDSIEGDRLYPLYHLAAYWGLRRSELVGLEWAELDLKNRRLHVRQAQATDGLDDTKSEAGERIIVLDQATADVLRAWRKAQLAERMAWGAAWTDTERVFTREDGQPLRPGYVSEHMEVLVAAAGLPPITPHGLRHGAATMLMAAGQPPKVVSGIMGHSTTAFTADVYQVVLEELAEAAAEAIAAYMPRKARTEAAE